jgi:NADH:ubiquinone oxidoreductase subunit 5 (subunit L)/multisubunit Na+/H+ antiporter MnhA subunit
MLGNYQLATQLVASRVVLSSIELDLISLFIILAAVTRRDQIPFSSRFPAAMTAPTSVFALVTAGVYLLIRFSPVIGDWSRVFLLLFSGRLVWSDSTI